jgi:hypothetical protein
MHDPFLVFYYLHDRLPRWPFVLWLSGDIILHCSEVSPRGDAVHPKSFASQRHRMGVAAPIPGLFPRRPNIDQTGYAIGPSPLLLPSQAAESGQEK